MKIRNIFLTAAGLALAGRLCAEPVTLTVNARPMHAGRIQPTLFGNFIELLDDVVPGMWAEMLNDRSFEGITPPSNWCYDTGEPDICDRPWDTNETWTIVTTNVFNGARCAKLTATSRQPASLTQSGLASRHGETYLFSGYFRAGGESLRAKVILKTPNPLGGWMELASADLPHLKGDWRKYSLRLVSKGETDKLVFELRVSGKGSVFVDKLSLMPASNRRGWRPDAIAAIKESHPSIIRWGGSTCDPGAYRWKNGIGDRDLRTPFPNKVWGRIDPNDVGIDEFCAFCELTGSEPLICLSFSDGPDSARDLVEYCNSDSSTPWGAKRAAHGHPKPYHVKYWQIGNEIGGDDPNYLAKVVKFCDEMKKVDPEIHPLSSFPSQGLLDHAGKEIDYIGPHHYTPDFGSCERDFVNLGNMIDNTPDCSHIKIAVTEWNVSGGSWGLERGRLQSLETALLNARYLNLLMRHSDKAEIACRSNMANSFGSGIIATSPSGLLKRTAFYVMKLYATHAKPVPLTATSSSGSVDVMACAADDRSSLAVFAVNSQDKPVECALNYEGFSKAPNLRGGEVVCDTRDARQLDIRNYWTAPDRVKTVKLETSGSTVTLPAYSVAVIECEAR